MKRSHKRSHKRSRKRSHKRNSKDGNSVYNTLLEIAKENKFKTVESLLEDYNKNPEKYNKYGLATLAGVGIGIGGYQLYKKYKTYPNKMDLTVLMITSLGDNAENVKIKIVEGVDVNEKTKDGMTVLMYACILGYVNVVKYLLTLKNIDINMKDNNGIKALDYANKSQSENKEVIIGLLSEYVKP